MSFPITDSDIRRWAIAVYYPEPAPRLFWDAEYAAGTCTGASWRRRTSTRSRG